MNKNNLIVKDVDGVTRVISNENILAALVDPAATFLLFGMNFNTILAFKCQYEKEGGKLPITPDRIEGLFGS